MKNRLFSVDDGSTVTNYGYDADGICVSAETDGNVTRYLVDKKRDYAQVLEETVGGRKQSVARRFSAFFRFLKPEIASPNLSSILSFCSGTGEIFEKFFTSVRNDRWYFFLYKIT